MSDFLERLIIEQAELEEKVEKLESFMLTDNFHSIPDNQRILLSVQLPAMKAYLACIDHRIDLLKNN